MNTFLVAADTNGNIQCINIGTNDNGTPIFYELETQEIELSERSHIKKVQNKIVVLSQKAEGSQIKIKQDDKDYEGLQITLDSTVCFATAPKIGFHYLTFKWLGNSKNLSPVLDGFYIKEAIDQGING